MVSALVPGLPGAAADPYLAAPVTDAAPSAMPATLFGMLRYYLRHRRGTVTLLGALLLASTGAQALTPLIVRHVIDSAMTGAALADLVWWGAAYGGAATLAFAITIVATFLSVRIGWQSTNALRVDLLRHTVRLDLRFHHSHSPGEMIERVDGDITLMSNYFAEFVVQIVGNALVIIGVMAVIFSQDWRVGAVMTGFVVVSWSVLLAMRSIGVEQWQRTRQASGELFGFLEETLTGMEDIHTSGGQPFVIRQFYKQQQPQHHPRVVPWLPSLRVIVVFVERAQVYLLQHIDDEVRYMIAGQPFRKARRQKEILIRLILSERRCTHTPRYHRQ